MARRRLGFYARCGLRTAGYDTEMFGVHYKTLYLAGGPVDDAALMEEHRFVYENTFSADKYHKYVRIPFDPKAAPGPKVPAVRRRTPIFWRKKHCYEDFSL